MPEHAKLLILAANLQPNNWPQSEAGMSGVHGLGWGVKQSHPVLVEGAGWAAPGP